MDPETRAAADGALAPPRRWGTPVLVDLLVAGGATLAAVAVMMGTGEAEARDPDLLGLILLVVAGALLLVRRSRPVPVLVAVVLVTTVILSMGYAGGTELPLVLAALYTAMAEGYRTGALVMLAGLLGGSVGFRLLVEHQDPLLVVVTVSPLILVTLLGDATHTRRQLRAEVRERLRVLEADKERETRARLTSERLQIARELHDVLAHTITAITVQAGAQADGLAGDDQARAALRSMRTTAQEAMQQLQATIAVLRSEHDHASVQAAPGLSSLQALVAGVRETGLQVDVEVEGDQRPLPAAVEMTAYRIVQEALTNVIRHANADRARVTLRYAADALTVTIVDDGAQSAAATPGEGGHGILGMRERAQSLGGTVSAGPAPGGGFRVEARVPAGKDDQ